MFKGHSDAGEKFLNGKGFCEVIIGTRIKSGNLIHDRVTCGKHNGRRVLLAAYASQDFKTIQLGEKNVQQDKVIIARERFFHTDSAILRLINLIAFVHKLEFYKTCYFIFVLNNKNLDHACSA